MNRMAEKINNMQKDVYEDNEKSRAFFTRGLAGKLIRFVIMFTFILGIIFVTISAFQIKHLGDVVSKESTIQEEYAQKKVEGSLDDITTKSLYQMNNWAADKIDSEFWTLDHDMRVLKMQVIDVFKNPDRYEAVKVSRPVKENAGKYTLQLLYRDGYIDANPLNYIMISKLANLEPMMKEMVEGNEDFSMDIGIALPEGMAIIMDNLSDKKIDEDGNITPYDATMRPWFQGAIEKGDIYFSSAVKSSFYDFNEVVYGLPVYEDGKLVAVLDGSVRLDVLEGTLSERRLGKGGFSVLISAEGQLVCSSRTEGELMLKDDLEHDIRKIVNPELSGMIDHALAGERGIKRIKVDDTAYYAAYAPVKTVGWTQISFVNEQEIIEPTKEILSQMHDSVAGMISELQSHFMNSVIIVTVLLLVVMQIAIISASSFAKKRVKPIEQMTESVRKFVSEDMDFTFEDIYRTGDEIEELAHAFEKMSQRLKDYLEQIVASTAEKERLETTMALAANIQNKMLPVTEPDFYEKPGYELYARMEPAANVGGDLYDFYYIDDGRLVITVGDVSGKGVTAALFMALCKQMLKSQMIIHDGDVLAAVKEANSQLSKESADAMFVTVWVGIINLSTGEMNFVDAGHMYAAIGSSDGEFTITEDEHSILMAALDIGMFKVNTMTLKPGDTVYLYTDGITEANNEAEEMFGEERLLNALNESCGFSLKDLDGHVRDRVREFAGKAEQYDDMTTLCFKYKGYEKR